MPVLMARFGDIAKEMNYVYAITIAGIKPQQAKLKRWKPLYHPFPPFAIVQVSQGILFQISDLNISYYMNAKKNNFNLIKKQEKKK